MSGHPINRRTFIGGVAGIAAGKVLNNAGVKISPPPPTTASTKPAKSEAIVTVIHSMGYDFLRLFYKNLISKRLATQQACEPQCDLKR